MTEKIVADEFMESLTGFDEIAIEQKYGADILTLAKTRPPMVLRALMFVRKRREGLNDTKAYEAAMGLTFSELQAGFELVDEVMPDEPETEAGKG